VHAECLAQHVVDVWLRTKRSVPQGGLSSLSCMCMGIQMEYQMTVLNILVVTFVAFTTIGFNLRVWGL